MATESVRPAEVSARRTVDVSPALALRSVLLLLCAVLSVLQEQRSYAALPVAVLAVLAVSQEQIAALRRRRVAVSVTEAMIAGLAVALTGGARSPMLPYLLAPTMATGLTGATRLVLVTTGASVLGIGAGRIGYALGVPAVPYLSDSFAVGVGQWVLLGLAFGLVAGWAHRLAVQPEPAAADRYGEARVLLQQLRGVSRRLPSGLDLPAAAASLLDRSAELALSHRSAVLVETAPGVLVSAAARGLERVPWREPLSSAGPLKQAWDTRRPVLDARPSDEEGRRRGSCLAAVPLLSGEQPFGLLVLESYSADAYTETVLAELADVARSGAMRVETALLFEEVRSTVTVDERTRLAREIHDGLAQDMASLGYRLDELRALAARHDPELADQLRSVRADLTQTISNIRLSITELRTSVGTHRGLGGAITSYLRAIGSGAPLAVHVSLSEADFRLPSDTEVVLLQVVQAVAQDIRRTGSPGSLWVSLTVEPPSASLVVEHDGTHDRTRLDLADLAERLEGMGGSLDVLPRAGGGVRVEAQLEGEDDDGQGAAGR